MNPPSLQSSHVVAPSPIKRWGSFDGLRALAALGVILIHVDLVSNHQVTPMIIHLRNACAGVVPFFLCAAFYFAARREMRGNSPWKSYVKARANRLLLPFLFWGVLYTLLRAGLYLRTGQTNDLRSLLSDPVALMFNGGAVALYFLPLLFVGLIWLRYLAPFYRHLPIPALCVCWIVFQWIKWRIDGTGNQFENDSGRAFQAWTDHIFSVTHLQLNQLLISRWVLILLAHVLRCAPLITFAFLVVRLDVSPHEERIRRYWVVAVLVFCLLIGLLLCASTSSANLLLLADLTGACALVVAVVLSQRLPPTTLFHTIGIYTFGIYLVHQVVLTTLRLVIGNHLARPMGAPTALTIVAFTFACSYLLTALAARSGLWGRRLFAIET